MLWFFFIRWASIFAYMFRALGGDEIVIDLLAAVGIEAAWEIMIFVMALVFILWFFFDWLEICLIVLPILGPLLTTLDLGGHVEGSGAFLPWLLVVTAVNLQTSLLTRRSALAAASRRLARLAPRRDCRALLAAVSRLARER